MPQELAKPQALLKKMAADPKFAKRLQTAATPEQKKKILNESGFGALTETQMKAFVPVSQGGTLKEGDLATQQSLVGWVGALAGVAAAAAAAAA
jgi:hypothetical protein